MLAARSTFVSGFWSASFVYHLGYASCELCKLGVSLCLCVFARCNFFIKVSFHLCSHCGNYFCNVNVLCFCNICNRLAAGQLCLQFFNSDSKCSCYCLGTLAWALVIFALDRWCCSSRCITCCGGCWNCGGCWVCISSRTTWLSKCDYCCTALCHLCTCKSGDAENRCACRDDEPGGHRNLCET